jgi:Fe2+ transport system protein FeoA
MSTKEHVVLATMVSGTRGTVAAIDGGGGLAKRLNAIGIRIGAELVVTSKQYMRGPLTVKIGNAQVAIGFGMASKILVEPKHPESSSKES